jgi:hypothetical protein
MDKHSGEQLHNLFYKFLTLELHNLYKSLLTRAAKLANARAAYGSFRIVLLNTQCEEVPMK